MVGFLMICRSVAFIHPREWSLVGFFGVGTSSRFSRVMIRLTGTPRIISSTAVRIRSAWTGSISCRSSTPVVVS